MWCVVISRTWSSSATRTRTARTSGPRRRSNGLAYSPDSTSATPSSSAATIGSGTSIDAWTTCTAVPSRSSTVVRNDSCRRTRPASDSASAGTSGLPSSRRQTALLYSGSPGRNWSRNHRRCWENDNGNGVSRSALGMTSEGRARPASLRLSCARSSSGSASILLRFDDVIAVPPLFRSSVCSAESGPTVPSGCQCTACLRPATRPPVCRPRTRPVAESQRNRPPSTRRPEAGSRTENTPSRCSIRPG